MIELYKIKPDFSSLDNADDFNQLIDVNWENEMVVLVEPLYQLAYWTKRGYKSLKYLFTAYSRYSMPTNWEEAFVESLIDYIIHLIDTYALSIGRKAIAKAKPATAKFTPKTAKTTAIYTKNSLFKIFDEE